MKPARHSLTRWSCTNYGGARRPESQVGMVKRKISKGAECPVARSLDVIGDRWSLLIVRNAFDGMSRFSEFRKDIGLSKSILATRLRSLVANGILEITQRTDGSAYQEYVLTVKGRGLFHIVVGLRQWGEDHLLRPGEAHSVMIDTQKGLPIRRLELRSEDGRLLLNSSNTVIKKVPDLSVPKGRRK
jgi:DNA-binding HxlR family transcriptional regulator